MVRKRLRGQITEQFLTQDGSLDILQLHPQWEAEMTRAEAEAGRSGKCGAAAAETADRGGSEHAGHAFRRRRM
jgi:flagellar biosynthesis component FlhA